MPRTYKKISGLLDKRTNKTIKHMPYNLGIRKNWSDIDMSIIKKVNYANLNTIKYSTSHILNETENDKKIEEMMKKYSKSMRILAQ